ncbi:hypothetical protein [Streptomyces cadmiisoli]|uniref:hypothetical protein n=1 Tax=Streptomyces cadmiisoli TaxID=2184053 RepID=UPI00364DB3C7
MHLPSHALRTWLAAAGTVLVLAAGSGCTSGDGAGVRSEGSGGRSESEQQDGPAPSDNSSQDGDDAGLRYASCMRDNGVQVPDPGPDGGVQVPTDVPQSQVERAEKVCGKNPAGGALGGDLPDSVRTDPELQALRLKFDACLKKNGYEMPKPKEENGSVTFEFTPEFRVALEACKAEDKAVSDRFEELTEAGEQ